MNRRQAVEAAYELIAAEGPFGLSMRKLATSLHVSLPTVYTAVESRETLIGELQDRVVAEIAATVHPERLSRGGTGLTEVAADLLEWARRRPELARFLVVEPMSGAVARRALAWSTPGQRAAGRALLVALAPAGTPPAPAEAALAFVFAEVRAMLWLTLPESQLGVDSATWLAIACGNVARGLSTLAGEQPLRPGAGPPVGDEGPPRP